MSKVTEYFNLFLKGVPHSKEILDSIVNNVKIKLNALPEDQKEEIIKRRLICETCPFMSRHAPKSPEYKALTGRNYKVYRKGDHCSFCGCGIEMRTGSLYSDCGIETWNAAHPDNKLPLKWTKFKEDGKSDEN